MQFSEHPLSKEALRARFEAVLPDLRHAAWNLGYSLGVRGSLTRDLDLIGAPWIKTAAPGLTLAEGLAAAVGGFLHPDVSKRPHGRLSWLIYPPWHFYEKGHARGYIDLSVMPCGR